MKVSVAYLFIQTTLKVLQQYWIRQNMFMDSQWFLENSLLLRVVEATRCGYLDSHIKYNQIKFWYFHSIFLFFVVQWLSPEGCLMFSLQIHVPLDSPLGARPSLVQHLVAVAVVSAIRKQPGCHVSLKLIEPTVKTYEHSFWIDINIVYLFIHFSNNIQLRIEMKPFPSKLVLSSFFFCPLHW